MTLSPAPAGVKARAQDPPPPAAGPALAQAPGPGPILAAVSGGGDSVALLRLLALAAPERGWRLIAAHVDHGLRKNSAADARWVERLAGELGLAFVMRRVAVDTRGRSPEEAARAARREALREMADQAGCAVIACAHNADDQAETLLMRLLVGSGPTGLAGMAVTSPPWWRPLLAVRRAELRAWLREIGQPWRRDPSNRDPSFLRNRVRLKLMPLAEELVNPRAVQALGRLAAIAAEEEEHWRGWCARAFARRARREGDSWLLEAPWLLKQGRAEQRRLIRELAARVSGRGQHLLAPHVEQALELLRGPAGRELTLPGGLAAWREHEGLRLGPSAPPRLEILTMEGPGRVRLPGLGLTLVVEERPRPPELKARGPAVWLPPGLVRWPLVLRRPGRGEVFQPLGAPGKKRVSRILLDMKVPAWRRRRALILADANGPLWLMPLTLHERARAAPGREEAGLGLTLVDTGHAPLYTRFFEK